MIDSLIKFFLLQLMIKSLITSQAAGVFKCPRIRLLAQFELENQLKCYSFGFIL